MNLELPGPNAIANLERELFKVFPNPASDYIVIENSTDGEFMLEIINSCGQILLGETDITDKITVITEKCQRGDYFVIIKNKAESVTFKIQLL